MKTDSFAYHVTKYFSDYLPNQTAASPNTIHSYRDTFVQLLNFFKKEKHVLPEKLRFSDFTSENVEEFLCWLEKERGIGASTRNQRLAAVHAFSGTSSTGSPPDLSSVQECLLSLSKKHRLHLLII